MEFSLLVPNIIFHIICTLYLFSLYIYCSIEQDKNFLKKFELLGTENRLKVKELRVSGTQPLEFHYFNL